MAAVWKQATRHLPCDRDPSCRGILLGEFYYELEDGGAIHALGFCRDREGRKLPAFPWDESQGD